MQFSDEELIAFLLGDASPRLSDAVEQRLQAGDTELMDRLTQLRMLLGHSDGLGGIYEPPADLVESTMARIADEVDEPAADEVNDDVNSANVSPVGRRDAAETRAGISKVALAGRGLSASAARSTGLQSTGLAVRHFNWDTLVLTISLSMLCCLAVPALVRAGLEARKEQCAYNLRTTGQNLIDFALNHPEGRFPYIATSGPAAFAGVFVLRLNEAGMLSSTHQLQCPSMLGVDTLGADPLAAHAPTRYHETISAPATNRADWALLAASGAQTNRWAPSAAVAASGATTNNKWASPAAVAASGATTNINWSSSTAVAASGATTNINWAPLAPLAGRGAGGEGSSPAQPAANVATTNNWSSPAAVAASGTTTNNNWAPSASFAASGTTTNNNWAPLAPLAGRGAGGEGSSPTHFTAARSAPQLPGLPRLAELVFLPPNELAAWQARLGGDYAYSLGVLENGRPVAPRRQGRSHFAILGDAPQIAGELERMLAHDGTGINILYEDGRVIFISNVRLLAAADSSSAAAASRVPVANAALTTAHSPFPDNPYRNLRGQHAVGLHPHDASLAPSAFAPLGH